MAAVSAPHAPTALTPPSSSHGGSSSWNFSVPAHQENPPSKTQDHVRGSQQTTGPLKHSQSRPELSNHRSNSSRSGDATQLRPSRSNTLSRKPGNLSESGSNSDSLFDLYGNSKTNISNSDNADKKYVAGDMYDDLDELDQSRWIHRDKLARIENEELQAAGIILPRGRATSKSSRSQSRDQQGNGLRSEQTQKRQRMESFPSEEEEVDTDRQHWDLRTPEEAAEDHNDIYRELNGKSGVSRIPVCKSSPVPIALTHLERDTPIKRKMSSGYAEEGESISYAKVRGRSQSIKTVEDAIATSVPSSPTVKKRIPADNVPTSPTKKTPTRVTSNSAGNRTSSGTQRPKTRSGGTRDASGTTRPTTRSGEVGAVSAIRPEGDPPWLATMYKPDPMLPPEQQLLPTVAKRLQQEQWEREGKFGTAYDTSFRPINDKQLQPPPVSKLEIPVPKPQENEKEAEWPLKASPKSPTVNGRPGTAGQQTYSTMPKIATGIPQGVGPLPSPRPPIRTQEAPETKQKEGCGCCLVM